MELKEIYVERYKRLLGKEAEKYFKKIEEYLPITIRVNTLKIEREKAIELFEKEGWEYEESKFWKNAFKIKSKVSIGNTLEYYLGFIYSQTFSSMVPPLVMEPKEDERILDMCASPGSKTTEIAQLMNNTGIIIANDKKNEKMKALRDNVQRMGVRNAILTIMDGRKFKNLGIKFDKVLLDAPCTGTGSVMKNWKILKMYNPLGSKRMSSIQKQLLFSAINISNEIIYSTCSLEPEEDEEVIDWAVKNFGVKVEKIKIKGINFNHGITEWEGKEFDKEVKNTIRIYPHKNDGFEGFFVARLKNEE